MMATYGAGTGIRTADSTASAFGEGAALIRKYAASSSMPVVSMGDDSHHPCQGLADVAGIRRALGQDLKGKRLLVTWAQSVLSRSRSSTQAVLLAASRQGMDVTLAHPPGYDLDSEVLAKVEGNAVSAGGGFRITHDLDDSYAGQHAVYSRNWVSPEAFSERGYEGDREVRRAMDDSLRDWVCDAPKMNATETRFSSTPCPSTEAGRGPMRWPRGPAVSSMTSPRTGCMCKRLTWP